MGHTLPFVPATWMACQGKGYCSRRMSLLMRVRLRSIMSVVRDVGFTVPIQSIPVNDSQLRISTTTSR